MEALASRLLPRGVMLCAIVFASVLAVDIPDNGSVESPGPRVTWGIGGFVGASALPDGATVELIGSYLRLGVQQSELVGLDLTGVGAVGALTARVGGAAMVTLTPYRSVTFGLGGIVNLHNRTSLCVWNCNGTSSTALQVGAAWRVDLHLVSGVARSGSRHAFTIGLEGYVGAFVDGRGPAAGVALTIGYARY